MDMMPMIEPLQLYLDELHTADCLAEIDSIMYAAAADPLLSSEDFVFLCATSKTIISAHGWIS